MCLRRPADNRCCCGLLHVTTGTLIIAVMVICFHGLAFARQMHGSNIDNVSGTALSSAMHFFNLIAGIMAVIGVKRHKPKLLIPLLVIMILYIVCLIFVIIITLLGFRSKEIINSLQRAKLLSRHDTGNTARKHRLLKMA
ncbi:hypothetical protein L596_022190 [Steinernema carpocapsae]|uniref:Uncharacterized protein n=1 Tax=Steinernema carpocapsae TaxID=34508 RepID=A0A4U5ML12_STECR|nr:hypothetical protein L596_022190 [Steinernema carpocapsae]